MIWNFWKYLISILRFWNVTYEHLKLGMLKSNVINLSYFLTQIHCQEEYMSLCRFIRHQLVHNSNNDKMLQDIHQQKVPPLPYIFQTPKGLLIDLRLFSRYRIIDPIVNLVVTERIYFMCWIIKSKQLLLYNIFVHMRLGQICFEIYWDNFFYGFGLSRLLRFR